MNADKRRFFDLKRKAREARKDYRAKPKRRRQNKTIFPMAKILIYCASDALRDVNFALFACFAFQKHLNSHRSIYCGFRRNNIIAIIS